MFLVASQCIVRAQGSRFLSAYVILRVPGTTFLGESLDTAGAEGRLFWMCSFILCLHREAFSFVVPWILCVHRHAVFCVSVDIVRAQGLRFWSVPG
jgi:hypothetical protein